MKTTRIEQINKLRDSLDEYPQIIAFSVREWEITKAAGLEDLAWAMCKESGYTTKNDAKYLLDMLEKWVVEHQEQKP